MVRTPRCGRGNPGSNPGYGSITHYIIRKVICENSEWKDDILLCNEIISRETPLTLALVDIYALNF